MRTYGNTDVAKGILILLIVFGHSYFIRGLSDYMAWVYFWHVQGFFLLMVLRAPSRGKVQPLDVIVRYFVPYLWFAGGIGLLRAGMTGEPSAVGEMVLGLVMGNSAYLQDYSGSVYWFIPSFTFALILWAQVAPRVLAFDWARMLGLTAFMAAVVAAMPLTVLPQIPLGLGVIPFIFVLLLVFMIVLRIAARGAPARALLGVSWGIVTLAVIWSIGQNDTVSPGYFRFGQLWITYVAALTYPALSMFLLLEATRHMSRDGHLARIGRMSFDIFIMHQLVLFPLTAIANKIGYATLPGAALGLLAIPLAIIIPIWFGGWLRRTPLTKRLIFPKDAREFFGRSAQTPTSN